MVEIVSNAGDRLTVRLAICSRDNTVANLDGERFEQGLSAEFRDIHILVFRAHLNIEVTLKGQTE
jgi:hypothetical protein